MDKEQAAISRLREAARVSEKIYKKPLIITTSGGKDSSVCVELAWRANINFELMHNHTTADAPETVRFLRSEFKRLEDKGFPGSQIIVNYPVYKGERTSMWELIPQKLMPPTRLVRYCCSILKEQGGRGRYITTGVRWAESERRKASRGVFERGHSDPAKRIILNNDNDESRRQFETCLTKHKAATYADLKDLANGIPAADVEPVRHGEWVGAEYDGYVDGMPVYDAWLCTACGEEIDSDNPPTYRYCPNCGAKMDGDAEYA